MLAVLLGLAVVGCGSTGTLELTIVDASGETTPARIELRDATGAAVVPDDALPVFGDCGQLPLHNWVPSIESFQVLRGRARAIYNPFTNSSQFYSDGATVARLAPGRYSLTAFKGIEHEVARAEVEIVVGATQRLRLELKRWIDLPAAGWYGADDHLHIPRPHPRFDPAIATWMQAEDIHVANLLQMGLARDVHITPQHGFGEGSIYRDGDTLVVAGQENPRTHVLGHSIVLGAREWIDFPADYLQYDRFWREAHEQGAVTGYAHWGRAGAEEGLALWGHLELIDFIEVLGFGLPFYERWYEVLDLGLRMGPTAGTDFPCSQSLPGRERFYARLDGPLEYQAWLEAVRLGRTFVTNGPVVELLVNGAQPGDELRLSAPGTVNIDARVRFDPARDDVRRLELVRGGEVVLRADEESTPGEIRLEGALNVEQSSWLALRASGWKREETEIRIRGLLESMLILERRTNEDLLRELPSEPVTRPSAAHTAAVYVTVDGTPPIAEQQKAREVADAWLDRLDELHARFDDDRLKELTGFPGRGDGIDAPLLRANRDVVLRAIKAARQHHAATHFHDPQGTLTHERHNAGCITPPS